MAKRFCLQGLVHQRLAHTNSKRLRMLNHSTEVCSDNMTYNPFMTDEPGWAISNTHREPCIICKEIRTRMRKKISPMRPRPKSGANWGGWLDVFFLASWGWCKLAIKIVVFHVYTMIEKGTQICRNTTNVQIGNNHLKGTVDLLSLMLASGANAVSHCLWFR